MNEVEILSEIVFDHEYYPDGMGGQCECGHSTSQDVEWYPYDRGQHAIHVAQLIQAAGFSNWKDFA